MKVIPADEIAFATFLETFNAAYSDYIVPIHMELSSMRRLIIRDAVDLHASQVVMDGDQVAGVAMLALRDTRSWIGGLGLLPAYRGKGLGRQLMNALINAARENGATTVQLEVIQGNTNAYMLYLNLGFQVQRQLLVLERQPAAIEEPPSLQIKSVTGREALAYYAQFHREANPWQRDIASLKTLQDDLGGFLALRDGQVVGYSVGWFFGDVIRWMDIAATPGEDTALRSLVTEAHLENPEVTGSLVNLGADDPAWTAFEALGYTPKLIQFEMVLPLT